MATQRSSNYNGRAARLAGVAVLGVAVLTASGCLIRSSSSTSYAGNRITSKSLARLVKGETTEEFVLATIGAADDQHELSDGSVLWKYSWTEKRHHSGAVAANLTNGEARSLPSPGASWR